MNKAREVYFDLIKMQKMAHTKYLVKKKVVQEGKKPPVMHKAVTKCMSTSGKRKRRFQPGTKVVREIRKFQKLTELLIPKIAMFILVKEMLQKEKSWFHIQVSAILALHEAARAYLLWLFKDSNLCAIHTKHVTVIPRDMQLVRQIRGKQWGSVF